MNFKILILSTIFLWNINSMASECRINFANYKKFSVEQTFSTYIPAFRSDLSVNDEVRVLLYSPQAPNVLSPTSKSLIPSANIIGSVIQTIKNNSSNQTYVVQDEKANLTDIREENIRLVRKKFHFNLVEDSNLLRLKLGKLYSIHHIAQKDKLDEENIQITTGYIKILPGPNSFLIYFTDGAILNINNHIIAVYELAK